MPFIVLEKVILMDTHIKKYLIVWTRATSIHMEQMYMVISLSLQTVLIVKIIRKKKERLLLEKKNPENKIQPTHHLTQHLKKKQHQQTIVSILILHQKRNYKKLFI